MVEGDTPLYPHVCFHFYVMIKEMRRAWLFEFSESPSRGYWKQFLLSRLYEKSLPPPPTYPNVCFHFYVMIKVIENLRAWLFEVSESLLRGYWKQFLLSHPYDHSVPLYHKVNSDSVQRDKIGEIVSSILLKGFQKLQITRLFSFPLS